MSSTKKAHLKDNCISYGIAACYNHNFKAKAGVSQFHRFNTKCYQ